MNQFKCTSLFILFVLFCLNSAWADSETFAAQQAQIIFSDALNNPKSTVDELKEAVDGLLQTNALPESREYSSETGPAYMQRFFEFAEDRVDEKGQLRAFNYWEAKEYIDRQFPVHTRNEWRELGPNSWGNRAGHWNPGIGRFNGICEDPKNKDIIYVGTPAGGCWKTTNAGKTWQCLTDDLPALGVTSIVVDFENSGIVYLGTGDGDGGNVGSIGVLKSFDAGATWQLTGLTFQLSGKHRLRKLLMDPSNTKILFAATNGGLYKTDNAGESWNKIRDGNIDDIEFKPGNSSIVYAMIARGFYRSTNGGSSFTKISSGLPSTQGRSLIGVTPANPEYVYVLSSKTSGSFQGVYRSANSGTSFSLRGNQPSGIYGYNADGSSTSHQTNYDLAFCVSPIDPDEAHLANILTWRSVDGGRTWKATTQWRYPVSSGYEYTHCDIHALEYFGNRLYVGSDGLVCRSTNKGSDFEDIVNGHISVRQFYKIAVAQGSNVTKIVGGAQDNGTCFYDGDKWWDWMGADGMDCMVSPDGNTLYGTTQNGSWRKRVGNSNASITQPGGGGWVTPAIMHPTNDDILFVGNDAVTKSTNGGRSWQKIGLDDGRDKKAITLCKSNPNYIYVTRSSYVYMSSNGGSSWSTISSNGLPSSTASNVAVNPEDPRHVVVTYGGFTSNRKIYVSKDAGSSWKNISENLPNVPANCAVFDLKGNLYIGMDIGVYIIGPQATKWVRFGGGLPNVIVKDLDLHYTKNILYAATYGRGLWYTDIANVGSLDYYQPSENMKAASLTNYPNPFINHTMISFSLKKPNKVTLQVYGMKGNVVQTLVNDHLTEGTHHISWDGKDKHGESVATGVYMYKLISQDIVTTSRMMRVE